MKRSFRSAGIGVAMTLVPSIFAALTMGCGTIDMSGFLGLETCDILNCDGLFFRNLDDDHDDMAGMDGTDDADAHGDEGDDHLNGVDDQDDGDDDHMDDMGDHDNGDDDHMDDMGDHDNGDDDHMDDMDEHADGDDDAEEDEHDDATEGNEGSGPSVT